MYFEGVNFSFYEKLKCSYILIILGFPLLLKKINIKLKKNIWKLNNNFILEPSNCYANLRNRLH